MRFKSVLSLGVRLATKTAIKSQKIIIPLDNYKIFNIDREKVSYGHSERIGKI